MNAVDKQFVGGYSGKVRKALHAARRSLAAKRNGVAWFFSAAPSGNGLEVHARNTRPDKVNVSRKFYVGARGGLFVVRPNYKRYIRPSSFGKGML